MKVKQRVKDGICDYYLDLLTKHKPQGGDLTFKLLFHKHLHGEMSKSIRVEISQKDGKVKAKVGRKVLTWVSKEEHFDLDESEWPELLPSPLFAFGKSNQEVEPIESNISVFVDGIIGRMQMNRIGQRTPANENKSEDVVGTNGQVGINLNDVIRTTGLRDRMWKLRRDHRLRKRAKYILKENLQEKGDSVLFKRIVSISGRRLVVSISTLWNGKDSDIQIVAYNPLTTETFNTVVRGVGTKHFCSPRVSLRKVDEEARRIISYLTIKVGSFY